MPLYIYRAKDEARSCDACRLELEVLQRMSAKPLRKCPECGAPISKQVTAPNSAFPEGPAQLRNMGMARLERRSDGSYENVSAQDGHQRVGSLESFTKDLSTGKKPIIKD
jgi:putative FmdB family regulatory protein